MQLEALRSTYACIIQARTSRRKLSSSCSPSMFYVVRKMFHSRYRFRSRSMHLGHRKKVSSAKSRNASELQ